MLGFGGVFMRGWVLWLVLSSVVQFLGVNWGSLSASPPVLRSCSPPCVLVHSHDSVSWKGFFLGRERRNHTLEILEPRLLSHTSLAQELTIRWNICSSLWSFFPCPSYLSRSLSLGHFPKKSNTDINTGRVQLLSPQCTQYVNNPSSFIGRAGWWQAPTDPNNGCLCRICSLCLARGPSTGTTEDSAEEGTKQLLMKCAQQTETIHIAWPRLAAVPYKYCQRSRDWLSEVGNKTLEGSEQCRKQCYRQQTWVMTLTVTRTQCRSMGSPPGFTPPSISASRLMLLTRRMLMSFSQQKAWIKVKWIWRATSSSSSVASRHNTTLSGSLKARQQEREPSGNGNPRSFTGSDATDSTSLIINSRIQWLCCLIDSGSDATLRQCRAQDLL